MARALDQRFDQRLAAGDKSARRTESLAECPDQYRHIAAAMACRVHHTATLDAVYTPKPCASSIISQASCCFDSADQLVKRTQVAIHAEGAVADNEFAS